MPATLEPLRPIKCTYKDCYESFDNKEAMRNHKKYSDEHDYCHKCDEDFGDYEEYAFHKITKPEEHGKACRVCGDEFKSLSGLRRHIELNHKVDQKLTCIGCHLSFHRACLFIEHLEFGHCSVIPASQFQGHIVHKHLITELLQGGATYERFQQKQAKYEAALDCEEEGGVNILDDDVFDEVEFEAIKPDTPPDTPLSITNAGPFPPLPSQMQSGSSVQSDLASTLGSMSLSGGLDTSTVVNSPVISPVTASLHANSVQSTAAHETSIAGSTTAASSQQRKVWGSREGKSTSSVLFPGAKPTPVPSEFSIAAHDDAMEQAHGLNIMRTRFWDPMSSDFNPDRFYDAILNKYYCPFVCEQNFSTPADLNKHIMNDHRITRMKCPMCLKYFSSAFALMAHCESRGAKCQINKADDFNIFLDRLSGGFLGVEEKTRPDHLDNPTVMIRNADSGRMEKYKPPVASYLQYMVTKPPDWKEPVKTAAVIGGVPNMDQYYRW